MPSNPPTAEMGRLHEEYIARVLDGTRTRASGSQWFDQGDVRNGHDEPFAFCADGKSTKGKSLSVSLDVLAKLREQSQGERPVLPLRFYGNDNLDVVLEDWFLVTGPDMEEMLPAARAWAALQTALGDVTPDEVARLLEAGRSAERLAGELAQARESLRSLGNAIAAQAGEIEAKDAEIAALRGGHQDAPPPEFAQMTPKLPWTVVRILPKDTARTATPPGFREYISHGQPVASAVYYRPDGFMDTFKVRSVRVERSMGNRPRLFVDDVLARDADLYGADGILLARVCADDPSIEVG